MRWFWQKEKEEPEDELQITPEKDPVKHMARQEQEFIRIRLRNLRRLLREDEQWTRPR